MSLPIFAIVALSLCALLLFHANFLFLRERVLENGVSDPAEREFDINIATLLSHINLRPLQEESSLKVFLFVIDALRFDFLASNATSNGCRQGSHFGGVHRLLHHNQTQTAFYKLRADPPTVTSQRIDGLTTGSLPVLLEIGRNLNAVQIEEDNLIDQFKRHGRR